MPQDQQALLQQALSGDGAVPPPAKSWLLRLLSGELTNPFTGEAPPTPQDHTGEGVLEALSHAQSIGPALTNRQMADAQMKAEGPGGEILRGVAEGGFAAPIKAFHGSPHSFEKFSTEHIGTGEGAQAYGHGLYFAENPAVAEGYRQRLSGAGGIIPGASQGRGKWMVGDVPAPEGIVGHRALDTAQDIQGLLYYEKAGYPDMAKVSRDNIERRIQWWREGNPSTGIADQDMRQLVDYYETHVKGATPEMIRERPPGKMYEVQINAEPEHFLDYDKPFTEQPPQVQQAMRALGFDWDKLGSVTGQQTYQALADRTKSRAAASDALRTQGVQGIKYLDQGSRQAGEGSRNYVVFDEHLIDILRKYGLLPAAIGLGAAAQDKQ